MQVQFFNLDAIFDPERVVDDPKPLDKNKKLSDTGICSEKLFGKQHDYESINWSCNCGKYHGKFFKDYVCEDCNTPVTYSDENTTFRFAWIDLKNFYVISPIFYKMISRLAGGDVKLNNMLKYEKRIDKDGNIIDEVSTASDYNNIGLGYFKENFFEGKNLLKYLYVNSKNKQKSEIYNLILKHKDKIFINHIPIYDLKLRPSEIIFGSEKPNYRFDDVNIIYNFIIKYNNIINEENQDFDLVILPNLFNIQLKVNALYEKIIENLSGKTGFIRASLLGNRVNFSARAVISPLPAGHDMCDIVLPYIIFIELYNFQLCNLLSKSKNITLSEAKQTLFKAQTSFSQEIYDLCMDLVNKTENGLLILGNRNPTIARGSMICHKIAGVKSDFTDLTISLHNNILNPLGGDYDGDCYNLFLIYDEEIKKSFYNVFSPNKMMISNNTGEFDDDFSIERDQVIGIRQFINEL